MLSGNILRQLSRFSTTSFQRANIEVSDAAPYVFHVELNRPEKRNTFTLPVWRELQTVFDELSANPKCRAIVLSGRGKSFTAGIDLQEGFGELMTIIQDDSVDISRKARKMNAYIAEAQDGFTALERCIKPVIVAVHSHCIGAGFSLITAADIRYASRDAIISLREVDVGLAADVGALNRIQKMVGNDSLTRELAYTGRDITADEALVYGLVSAVCSDREAVIAKALATATTIAEKSPIAVQGSKLTLNHARDHTIRDSLEFVKIWNQSQILSDDIIKAATGALKKEKSHFDDV